MRRDECFAIQTSDSCLVSAAICDAVVNLLLSLASFLGGLGLVFTGVRNLSATMLQLGGRRLRSAITTYGQNHLAVAIVGTASGALLQSSNGITFILVSMITAGLLPMISAMPLLLWANFGTSLLVFAASINLHFVTLVLLGISGIGLFLDRETGTTRRQVMEAALAIALLFLGVELLRAGAAGMPDNKTEDLVIRRVMGLFGDFAPASFILGFLVTLVTQSSSTTTIIAVTATQSGLLSFQNAALSVVGASLGSGVSVVLLGASTRGSQRQLVLFQGLTKLLGVIVLLALILIEEVTGADLVLSWIATTSLGLGRELALVYLSAQLTALASYYALAQPIRHWLAAVAPPLPAESLAMPQFIYAAAVGDADIALILAEKEQLRLISQLGPDLEQPDRAAPSSFDRLSLEIERFIGEVAGSGDGVTSLPRDQLDLIVNLRARNEVLRLLHDTITQLCAERVAVPAGEAAELADALTQGLCTVLLCADDAANDSTADNIELLKTLSSDRSNLVDAIRRRLVKSPHQESVYRLTGLFERAVWLVHRYALLLEARQAA